jgi:hypothetical protein
LICLIMPDMVGPVRESPLPDRDGHVLNFGHLGPVVVIHQLCDWCLDVSVSLSIMRHTRQELIENKQVLDSGQCGWQTSTPYRNFQRAGRIV